MKRLRKMIRKWWRVLRATLRDARLILRDSWLWLAALVLLWFGLGLILWRGYGTPLSFGQALYLSFSQMTLNPIPAPESFWIHGALYLTPALTIIFLGRGALNIGLLLFDRRNRREAWNMALASTYRNHVIVVGLGKIGYRVVQQLLATNVDVVVLDSRSDGPFHDLISGRDVPVIVGDARQSELLHAAGLDHAQSLAVVTGDDLTNLDVALTARQLRPNLHIVMRVFNDSLASKLDSAFGINTAFSTSALAAPTLAAAAIGNGITNALYVAGKLLSTIEVTVERDGILDGRLIQTVEDQHDVSILYQRNRQGEDLRPRSDYRLAAGDIVVIIGQLDALNKIQAYNREHAAPHSPIRRA